MKNFMKENWFKIALLIAIFWLLLLLQNGIEIHHRGWVDTEPTGLNLNLEL